MAPAAARGGDTWATASVAAGAVTVRAGFGGVSALAGLVALGMSPARNSSAASPGGRA